MKISIKGVNFRVTSFLGKSKLEMMVENRWQEVDPEDFLLDLLEAAYIDGKLIARDEIRKKMGL